MAKAIGQFTISYLDDGTGVWTTTTAPTTPNYTFNISNLTGMSREPMVGDIIVYSYYRYTISSVGSTTVLAGTRTSIRGATGAAGTKWYSGTGITGTSTTATVYPNSGVSSANANDLYVNNDTQNVYQCVAGGNASTATWKYISNIRGEDGTSPLQAVLSNESHTLTANSSGVPTSYTGCSTTITVYEGVNDVTSQYTITKTDPSGVASQLSGSTVSVTGVTNGIGGTITIKAKKGSIELIKGFAISVSKAGTDADALTITTQNIQYKLTDDATQPTSGWNDNIPPLEPNKYLWTKTYVKYSDNTETISYSVSYLGKDGTNGQPGADGRGISSTTIDYAKSTNGETAPSSGWQSTIPSLDPEDYLWTRTVITYTSGSPATTTSYSVGMKGATGSPGSPGADAKVVIINPSSQVFKSTTGASGTFTPQYIYLYPSFQGCSYSKWQYSTDGTTWNNVTSGSNSLTIGTYNSVANSLRIERNSNLYSDSTTAVSFKCISNTSTVYDTVTVIKVYDVTDIQVGGRNLVLETGKAHTITGTGGTNDTGGQYHLSDYGKQITKDISSGWQFTFSFDWETTATSGTIKAQFSSPYYGGCSDKITVSSSNTSGHSTYSGVATYATQVPFTNVYFRLDNLTGTVTIKNAKLEIGNVETDWTPAPEDLTSNIDYIVGTQTASTNAFTGVASFPALRDGQQITYWLPYAGTSSNATLNLTLSTGSTTGAKNVYYGGTTRLTTHYPAGSAIRMIYRENVSIAGSTTLYTGWWCDANYDTNNTDRLRFQNNIKTDQQYFASGRLAAAGENNLFFIIRRGSVFKINSPILYTGSNLNPISTGNNNYLMYSGINIVNNLTFNCDIATETVSSSNKGYSGTKITGTSTTATVFSGSGITSALVGDLYINTSTYYLYKCTLAGNAATAKWVYVKSLYTPVGKRWYSGTAITGTDTSPHVVSGSGISSAGVGDYYYNTSTGYYYECTLAGNASTAKWKYDGVLIEQYETIYLRGTLNNKLFTVADVPLTTTIPTTNDGYYYISLGTTYSLTAYGLFPEHPMYKFVDGEFKSLNQVAVEAQIDASEALDASVIRSATEPSDPYEGMLWYDTVSCQLFLYTSNQWRAQDMSQYAKQSDINDVRTNRNKVWIVQPTPPYNSGDLWVVQDTNDPNFGKILTCVTSKATGESYSINDWIVPLTSYTTLDEMTNVLGTDPREWSSTSKSLTTLINENTEEIEGQKGQISSLAVRASGIEMSFSRTGTMNFLGNSSGQNNLKGWTLSNSSQISAVSASAAADINQSLVSLSAFRMSFTTSVKTLTMTSDLFTPPTSDIFTVSAKFKVPGKYTYITLTVNLYSDMNGTTSLGTESMNIPYAVNAEDEFLLYHMSINKADYASFPQSAKIVITAYQDTSDSKCATTNPNNDKGKISCAGKLYKYSSTYTYLKPVYKKISVVEFSDYLTASSLVGDAVYKCERDMAADALADSDYVRGVYYTIAENAQASSKKLKPITDGYTIMMLDAGDYHTITMNGTNENIETSSSNFSFTPGQLYVGDIMVNGGQNVQTWTPRQDENLWGENIKFDYSGITIENIPNGYKRIIDSNSDIAYQIDDSGTIVKCIWKLTQDGFITNDIKCIGTFAMGYVSNEASADLENTFTAVMEMKKNTDRDGIDEYLYVNN